MKICFLFGHSDCPHSIVPELEHCIDTAVTNGVTHFYVGNRGNFDRLAAEAVKRMKDRHPEVCLWLLLAYHPAERIRELPDGFDGMHYPLMKKVPRQYAIVRANERMVLQTDMVVCYVSHPGNTRKLLLLAEKRHRKGEIALYNLGQI